MGPRLSPEVTVNAPLALGPWDLPDRDPLALRGVWGFGPNSTGLLWSAPFYLGAL